MTTKTTFEDAQAAGFVLLNYLKQNVGIICFNDGKLDSDEFQKNRMLIQLYLELDEFLS